MDAVLSVTGGFGILKNRETDCNREIEMSGGLSVSCKFGILRYSVTDCYK